jgi:hypothetical protein
MRAALALLLVVAGCTPRTSAEPPDAPVQEPEPPPPADTRETRAEAAGLSRREAAALDSLGVPVFVPALPKGWTLDGATAERTAEGSFPEYTLRLRTAEGTCLDVLAASEGLGDVFLGDPPHERDVRVPHVPTSGPARLGWGVAGETVEGWEDGRVATEWFGTDGLSLSVQSSDADGCRPGSPEAAETLLAALRPLDPADDAVVLGPTDPVEIEPVVAFGPDPEALARDEFAPDEPGEGSGRTEVETLRRRRRFAVVLVTAAGLADDSVRDERTRVVLARSAEGWYVTSAGRQVRCQPGRGHAGWSAEVCA